MWSGGRFFRAPSVSFLLHATVAAGSRSLAKAAEQGWCAPIRGVPHLMSVGGCRHYARNPMERLTMDQLKGSVGGGRGGRGGRGRKRGGKKGMRDTQAIWIGQGKGGERWPGLSYPLEETKYSLDWLQRRGLGMKKVQEEGEERGGEERRGEDGEEKQQFMLRLRVIEGKRREVRKMSEMGWDRKGWSGRLWGGRHIGCPELPDSTPLEDFRSVVIEVKRVANQTKGGKKRTVSALVVVGNGNGMAGFAVGRGDEIKAAIRKAKNRAVNYLQFIPRCEGHTIYHNAKVKYCKTNIELERRVKGHGLRCHRSVSAVCQLAGIKDMRAKVTGSNNPLNTVRATFKGLTSQESFLDLANRTGKFVVEYRRECLDRPVVVAVPMTPGSGGRGSDEEGVWQELRDLQLVPKTALTAADSLA
ncbi:28S ribosomal protein S5, mitochondrial [Geodia barretti]|uniref:Small ribosomal subunit protein uS5m n=1 Tax=Geodia barretti TaxID=519541 RepID=A0AA35WBI0_GEOBA|nr:28S ribosomal protein S5, mitochondrial [Geodia barretti]